MMGADPTDTLDDIFPGTGAVSRAWDEWRAEVNAERDLKGET